MSIKVRSRTLNNIVEFVKVSALRGLSILIFTFDFAGLHTSVHLNPLLCHRPNGERGGGTHKGREREREMKR